MSIVVNLEHRQQDIRRKRDYKPTREWYRFAAPMVPTAKSNERLVDVGGGAGEFTAYARSIGYGTTLIDGNSTSVKEERKRGHEATEVDLNDGLEGLPASSFDAAVCLEVIEHVVSAERLLHGIYRLLKPGGFLVVSTPNFAYVVDRIRYLVGSNLREEGYHYRFFTQRQLTDSLCQAGFRIDERNSVASALGVNFALRLVSFGHLRIPHFRAPKPLESWIASRFVMKAVRKR